MFFKRRFFIWVSLFVLAAIWGLAAGDDFTATWVFNKEKSDPYTRRGDKPDITMVVEQSEGTLKVSQEFSMRGNQRKSDYTLTTDGESSIIRVPGGEAMAKAKWEGQKLVIESEQTRQTRRGEMTFRSKETWELSQDGKVLTQTQSIETPRGSRTRKFVFEREQ
ncbi:MAG: hypothetical protein ACE5MK_04920 [Acidobacteriota bacterium]